MIKEKKKEKKRNPDGQGAHASRAKRSSPSSCFRAAGPLGPDVSGSVSWGSAAVMRSTWPRSSVAPHGEVTSGPRDGGPTRALHANKHNHKHSSKPLPLYVPLIQKPQPDTSVVLSNLRATFLCYGFVCCLLKIVLVSLCF